MKPVVVILNADINFELLGTSMDPAVLATAARAMLRDRCGAWQQMSWGWA
jgi:hypothetical protein